MAKSLRSKVKKRMRSAKAAHLWEVRGKHVLNRITAKLNDPNYDATKDLCLPPNAYLEPDNPNAVFPQWDRPDILDFRSNRIAGGGLTVVGTFRKHLSKNSKKSKYPTIVKSREELDAEEAAEAKATEAKAAAAQEQKDNEMEEMEAEPVAPAKNLKPVNVDDLTALTANLTIARKGKKKEGLAAPKIQVKSKAITKKEKNEAKKNQQCRRSKKHMKW